MVTSVPWQLHSSEDRNLERFDRDMSRAPARGPRNRGDVVATPTEPTPTDAHS
jgi:hypothetical protein